MSFITDYFYPTLPSQYKGESADKKAVCLTSKLEEDHTAVLAAEKPQQEVRTLAEQVFQACNYMSKYGPEDTKLDYQSKAVSLNTRFGLRFSFSEKLGFSTIAAAIGGAGLKALGILKPAVELVGKVPVAGSIIETLYNNTDTNAILAPIMSVLPETVTSATASAWGVFLGGSLLSAIGIGLFNKYYVIEEPKK